MKKTYIIPEVKITPLVSRSMLAESYVISSTHVEGSKALSREDNSWDIWGSDNEE